MEVHRQRCQKCSSTTLHNLLVRTPGKHQLVLVVCSACELLVARYELASYYHHGKGIESWLRSFDPTTESGSALQATFDRVSRDAVEEFERALAVLRSQGKEL